MMAFLLASLFSIISAIFIVFLNADGRVCVNRDVLPITWLTFAQSCYSNFNETKFH